jgi:hypothetical protein
MIAFTLYDETEGNCGDIVTVLARLKTEDLVWDPMKITLQRQNMSHGT